MSSGRRHLVVPISVEAFCVSDKMLTGEAPHFLGPLTSFERLPYNDGVSSNRPFTSDKAVTEPFESGEHQRGVHLHWAMPDALTHSEQDSKKLHSSAPGMEPSASALRFPRLPDRWLVTRTTLAPGSTGAVKQWIVDSRYISTRIKPGVNDRSIAIPWENPDDEDYEQPPFRYLGRTLEIDKWEAPQADSLLAELTAASLGYIQAPAFYPNCRNVFGMHDAAPAIGVESSYLVCGWHSSPGDDPLYGKAPEDAARALEKMHWIASAGEGFDATLYVGVVHSLRYTGEEQLGTPSKLTAVFGNTTSEANAALHTRLSANGAGCFEDHLQALLTGQLDRLNEFNGDLRVARQLHQQRFTPASYGGIWYVGNDEDGNDIFGKLSPAQKKLLIDLNAAEKLSRECRELAEARQWQLFADWYKYLRSKYREESETDLPSADDVRDFIEKQSLTLAREAIDKWTEVRDKVVRLGKELSADLPQHSRLFEKPQPDSWRPVDPVLLLQGDDVRPAMRFGGDGDLRCQFFGLDATDMLTALDLHADDVPDVPPARLSADRDTPAFDLFKESMGVRKSVVQAAMLQGLLLWPVWAAAQLAARAEKQGSADAIVQWLKKKHESSPWTGKIPAEMAVTTWSGNPWLPILMHWEIAYEPIATVRPGEADKFQFPPDALSSNLSDSLNTEETDLVLERTVALAESNDVTSYTGVSFITPQAGQRVKQQMQSYARAHPRSLLAAVEPYTRDIPLLSQSLAGFHDRLLLRRQTLQVDVRDPFRMGEPEKKFIKRVREVLSAMGSRVTTMAPLVQDRFSPIRGGDFMLRKLWLGDVFGQMREFPFKLQSYRLNQNSFENEVIVATALGRKEGADWHPSFPPRVSQPARLDFNWLSVTSDDELPGEDAAASPICGWIVPNYLDRSVAIYDDSGDSIGSIIIVAEKLRWQGSPAHPELFDIPIEDRFSGRNKQLREYVLALWQKGAKYLGDCLSALSKASNHINPEESAQHVALPPLVGQPLALTRAAVKLSLNGSAAVNQTWTAFKRDLQSLRDWRAGKNTTVIRTTNEHERVQYPVVLGMVNDPNDGLVGFYKGGETSRFDQLFIVAPEDAAAPGISPSHVHSLELTPEDSKRILTMLVDPRAAVVITPGYAPAQTRSLPAEAVKQAFAKIAVTFLAAPVLTTGRPPKCLDDSVSLPLPLPGRQEGDWHWLRVANVDGKRTPIIAQTEPADATRVLSNQAVYLQDGWLSLSKFQPKDE